MLALTLSKHRLYICLVNTALSIFNAIPKSQHGCTEEVKFMNCDLHDTFTPKIYSITGNELKVRGPIRVTEIRRRRKIRFIRVDFYEWQSTPKGHCIPKKYMASYAWQGETSIHLLEQPTVMDNDPFDENPSGGGMHPKDLDAVHSRLMTLSGEDDVFLDL